MHCHIIEKQGLDRALNDPLQNVRSHERAKCSKCGRRTHIFRTNLKAVSASKRGMDFRVHMFEKPTQWVLLRWQSFPSSHAIMLT
jgi:hypothetical protein